MCNRVENEVGLLPETWMELEPNDLTYARYKPNIVAALYKASEVFQAFCQARSLLVDSGAVDDQEPEGMGRVFRKATLLQAALMQYVTCWDLSWQPLWFKYVEEADIRLINDTSYYEERIGKCRISRLKDTLQCRNMNQILGHLNHYDDDEFWSFLRDTYNYIKHRGTHHISGIGENLQYSIFSVNGIRPRMIAHREFDVDEWSNRLIRFNREFIDYYNAIVEDVMPEDYTNPVDGIEVMRGILSLAR